MFRLSDYLLHLAAGQGGGDTCSERSRVFTEQLAWWAFWGGLRLSSWDRPGACSVGTLLWHSPALSL